MQSWNKPCGARISLRGYLVFGLLMTLCDAFLSVVLTAKAQGCNRPAINYPINSALSYVDVQTEYPSLIVTSKPTTYQLPNNSCSSTSNTSFQSAVAYCSARSMRLCEADENVSQQQKCSIWTSTLCGASGSDMRVLIASNGQHVCSNPTSTLATAVSCCVDVSSDPKSCELCPPGTHAKPVWNRIANERGLSICAAAYRRPNVLFIISDDMRYFEPGSPSATSSLNRVLPNFVKYSQEGVFFSNAHTQMAMCSPSRSSFLTGLRPDFTRLYRINDNLRRSKNIITLPQSFKQDGYMTIAYGKIFDGRSAGGIDDQDYPQSWNEPAKSFKGSTSLRSPEGTDCGYPDPPINGYSQPNPFSQCIKQNGTDAEEEALFGKRLFLPDEKIYNLAIAKISEFAKDPQQRPFFLAVGFLRPHLPFVAPERHFKKWQREEFPFNDTINGHRDDIFATVAYRDQEPQTYAGWDGTTANLSPSPRVHSRFLHAYHASCAYVDENLGKLVETFRSKFSALADNTIIVFFSDHGYQLGEHEFYAKKTVYDKGTRVPLLMFGPQKFFPQRGIRIVSPVELLDLTPTLLEMASVSRSRAAHQGTSLVPLFRANNPVSQVKSVALSQFNAFGVYRKVVMCYALRSTRYRFVSHYHTQRKAVLRQELYDYTTDPDELHDVKSKPEYADVLRRFRNLFGLYIKGPKDFGPYYNETTSPSTFISGF